MKIRIFTVFLTGVLLLAGCGTSAAANRLDAAEDALENRVDAIEDAVENVVSPTAGRTDPGSAAITREEAEAIALEHAGFTAGQVSRLRTEYEIDDGVARYEVTFRQGRWEYDYEISAETGVILSYDRDD